ncbi:hypothetical protein BCR44DRAFT_171691 [Catenaria anguillulae PL171]|uniref:Uncharacterized protein n=1 Tax=Catenaria anguillulae PL171 TaxID=765915 RepID=A0A1Y2HPK3_9FUNG|nr:hypothetical protein BCR44DRAFT_171691 [Catenaria anguillulae PL171]
MSFLCCFPCLAWANHRSSESLLLLVLSFLSIASLSLCYFPLFCRSSRVNRLPVMILSLPKYSQPRLLGCRRPGKAGGIPKRTNTPPHSEFSIKFNKK